MAGSDDALARLESGALWQQLCDTLRRATALLEDDAFPTAPEDRAEGLRYLLRFLDAGIQSCVEHADPDHPEFTRMMDLNMRWGLDSPDHLYLFATIRGDAAYRVYGDPGTANIVDFQVNAGHYALGNVGATSTVGSLDREALERGPDGGIELFLGGSPRDANWIALDDTARFVQVRQVFADWERERPARLRIERVGGEVMRPRLRPEQIAERIDLLCRWMEDGGGLWKNMSRVMLAVPKGTLNVADVQASEKQSGLKGQAYAMGNFHCEPGEAQLLSFTPPRCRHWSVSLATWTWEAIDFTTHQSSLNGAQAELDADGVFRAVISHEDPGVANWLDTSGHRAGTLIARFVSADHAPKPRFETVPLGEVRAHLHPDTPDVDASEREARLRRRRDAVWRRYRR